MSIPETSTLRSKWFGRSASPNKRSTISHSDSTCSSASGQTKSEIDAENEAATPAENNSVVWQVSEDGTAIARRGTRETAVIERPRFLFTDWVPEDEEDSVAGIELVEHSTSLVQDAKRLQWIHIQTADPCETVESLCDLPARILPFDVPLPEKKLIKTLLENVKDVRTYQSSTKRHHDPWGVRVWFKDLELGTIHSATSISIPYLTNNASGSRDDTDDDADITKDTHVVGVASENLLITVAPLEFRKLYNERVLRSLEAAEYGDQVIRLLDPNQRTFVLPYKLCATWFAFLALIRKQCFEDEDFAEDRYRFASVRGISSSGLIRGAGVEISSYNWHQYLDDKSTLVGDILMELRELLPVKDPHDPKYRVSRQANTPALLELLQKDEELECATHGVRNPVEPTIWDPIVGHEKIKDAVNCFKERIREKKSDELRIGRNSMDFNIEDGKTGALDASQVSESALFQILHLLKDKNREANKGVVGFIDDQLISRVGNKFTWTSSYGRLRVKPIQRIDLPTAAILEHTNYCDEGVWIPLEVFGWPCGEAFLAGGFSTFTTKQIDDVDESGTTLGAVSSYMDYTIIKDMKEQCGIDRLVKSGRDLILPKSAKDVLKEVNMDGQSSSDSRHEASKVFLERARLVYQFFYPWDHSSVMSNVYWTAVTRLAILSLSFQDVEGDTFQMLSAVFERFLYESSIISFSISLKPEHQALRAVAPHYALPEAFPIAFFALIYLLLASVEYFDSEDLSTAEGEKIHIRIRHYEYLLFRNLNLGKRALLATNHYLLHNCTQRHESPNSESLLITVLRRLTKASEFQTVAGRYQISVHLRRKAQQASQMKRQTRAADMAEMHKLQSQLDSVTAAKVTLERQLYFLDKSQMNFDWADKRAVQTVLRNSSTLAMNRRLLHGCQDAVKRQIAEAEKVENQLKQLLERVTRVIDLNRETSETATLIFTAITTIFFPFSAVTSYFGMNTKDIRDMNSTVWEFWKAAAVVSLVFTTLVLLIAFYWRYLQRLWEIVVFWKGWGKMKRKVKRVMLLDSSNERENTQLKDTGRRWRNGRKDE